MIHLEALLYQILSSVYCRVCLHVMLDYVAFVCMLLMSFYFVSFQNNMVLLIKCPPLQLKHISSSSCHYLSWRVANNWEEILKVMGMEGEATCNYAQTFNDNEITLDNIEMIDRNTLLETGITKLGHQMSILKLGKSETNSNVKSQIQPVVRSNEAHAPHLELEMTHSTSED